MPWTPGVRVHTHLWNRLCLAYHCVWPVGGTYLPQETPPRRILPPKILGTSCQRHYPHPPPSPSAQCPLCPFSTFGLKCQQPGCLTQYQASGRGRLPVLSEGWMSRWSNNTTVTQCKQRLFIALTQRLSSAPDEPFTGYCILRTSV